MRGASKSLLTLTYKPQTGQEYIAAHEAETRRRVVYVDLGGYRVKYGLTNVCLPDTAAMHAQYESDDGYDPHGRMRSRCQRLKKAAGDDALSGGNLRGPASIDAVWARTKGHYWSAGNGISQFIVGDELDGGNMHWEGFQPRRLWSRDGAAPPCPPPAGIAVAACPPAAFMEEGRLPPPHQDGSWVLNLNSLGVLLAWIMKRVIQAHTAATAAALA